jgi:hypothetical protein
MSEKENLDVIRSMTARKDYVPQSMSEKTVTFLCGLRSMSEKGVVYVRSRWFQDLAQKIKQRCLATNPGGSVSKSTVEVGRALLALSKYEITI